MYNPLLGQKCFVPSLQFDRRLGRKGYSYMLHISHTRVGYLLRYEFRGTAYLRHTSLEDVVAGRRMLHLYKTLK